MKALKKLFRDLKIAFLDFFDSFEEKDARTGMEKIWSDENLLEFLDSENWHEKTSAASKLLQNYTNGLINLTDSQLDQIIVANQPSRATMLSSDELTARKAVLKLERYALKTKNGTLFAKLFDIRVHVWLEPTVDDIVKVDPYNHIHGPNSGCLTKTKKKKKVKRKRKKSRGK